jgi:hypothetical protein
MEVPHEPHHDRVLSDVPALPSVTRSVDDHPDGRGSALHARWHEPASRHPLPTIGEVEYAYIQSFKTFALDFSYRNTTAGLADSVRQLTAWFAALDQDLRATIEGLSEDDITNRLIDRGGDFQLPPQIQLDVYKEALLIFYGKVSVYLRAMGKSLPQQWQDWLG